VFVESLGIHLRLAAFAAAIAPAALLFWLAWRPAAARDLRYAMASMAALGFTLAFPVIVVEALAVRFLPSTGGPVRDAIIEAFAIPGLIEESAKFLLVVCFALRHEDLRMPADIVRLAVAIALGFALIENLFYVYQTEQWAMTALIRAVTAVPTHAFYGLLMGTFAANARGRCVRLPAALLVPVLIHGLYDTLALLIDQATNDPTQLTLLVAFVLLLLVQAIAAVFLIRRNRRNAHLNRPIDLATP
jgi:RsiW-degrading membrane proteinase PrsW (M82 family)